MIRLLLRLDAFLVFRNKKNHRALINEAIKNAPREDYSTILRIIDYAARKQGEITTPHRHYLRGLANV